MWWLLAFVVFLIAEIISVSLTSIWFSLGALASFAVSFLTDNVWVQIVVFLIVSLILVLLTRPWAKRFFNNADREKTNIDAMIGREGVVTEEINNLRAIGEVSVSGQAWMARTEDNNITVAPGEKVIVKEVRGVKLIVEKENM